MHQSCPGHQWPRASFRLVSSRGSREVWQCNNCLAIKTTIIIFDTAAETTVVIDEPKLQETDIEDVTMLMCHDDGCGRPLDQFGDCPCGIHPGMQDLCLKPFSSQEVKKLKKDGRFLMGEKRNTI